MNAQPFEVTFEVTVRCEEFELNPDESNDELRREVVGWLRESLAGHKIEPWALPVEVGDYCISELEPAIERLARVADNIRRSRA